MKHEHDTAADAISESIARNCIARVTSTPENRNYLMDRCEAMTEADELEFWGQTETGDDWRVHCASTGNFGA